MTAVNSAPQPSSTPPAVPGDAGLTTGVLARRLGVSPMTLRSWDRRYGIGPTARTEGGHRRWTAADVATVEEMCRLTATGIPPADAARAVRTAAAGPPPAADAAAPAPPPPTGRSRAAGALPLGDVRQECRGLARAAVRLDAPALEKQLTAAVERHGVVGAWQEVMVPTLHAVGRRWASSGDRYVEVEHLLAWHVSTVLRRSAPPAAPWLPPRSAASCWPASPANSTPCPWRRSTRRSAVRDCRYACWGRRCPPRRWTRRCAGWARSRSCCGPRRAHGRCRPWPGTSPDCAGA